MRTPAERESMIQRLMTTCQHFNGIMNDQCKAGVNYEALSESHTKSLPCLTLNVRDPRQRAECALHKGMTREEAEAAYKAQEAELLVTYAAIAAAHADAKCKGLCKGQGGVSSMPCPVCDNVIDYSVASVNGHMHARCRTAGCVRWME